MFNSGNVTISITKGKTGAIILKIRMFLENKSPTIGELASVIGLIISLFPAIPFGKLHYRALEKDKTNALKKLLEILINRFHKLVTKQVWSCTGG